MHSEADIPKHRGEPDHTEPIPAHLDSWHQHGASEGVPRQEHGAHANVTALFIGFVVITLGTVVFSVIIGVYTIGQVNRYKHAGEVQGLGAVHEVAREYKQDALAAQEGYGWLDDGRVRLPIAEAMRMVAGGAEEQESR